MRLGCICPVCSVGGRSRAWLTDCHVSPAGLQEALAEAPLLVGSWFDGQSEIMAEEQAIEEVVRQHTDSGSIVAMSDRPRWMERGTWEIPRGPTRMERFAVVGNDSETECCFPRFPLVPSSERQLPTTRYPNSRESSDQHRWLHSSVVLPFRRA